MSQPTLITLDMFKEILRADPNIPTKEGKEGIGYDLSSKEVEDMLTMILQISTSMITSFLGRELGMNTYDELIENRYGSKISVDNYPIREVKRIRFINGGSMNVEALEMINDSRNYKDGIIETGGNLPTNMSRGGVTGIPRTTFPVGKIEYIAGYVLPSQATEDNPSDLPMDIQWVVMSMSKRMFSKMVVNAQADNLIALTEGNVKREWSSQITSSMQKHGEITREEQNALNKYQRFIGMYST